jgi:hypothetical protein
MQRKQRKWESKAHYSLYRITKKISAKYKGKNTILKDKDGQVLTKEHQIQKRWEEHFSEVLNREPPSRPVRIERGTPNEEINIDNITEEEIKWAIKRLKNKKAPGIDNISSEMLKADMETSVKRLKKIYDKIWREEVTPREWSRGILTTIP